MATIDLTFAERNNSVAINDYVNSIDTTTTSTYLATSGAEVNVGKVLSIFYTASDGTAISGMRLRITCASDYSHTAGNYIYFAKDSQVEKSSLTGYYAIAKFTNDSTSFAEIFSANSQVAISSK